MTSMVLYLVMQRVKYKNCGTRCGSLTGSFGLFGERCQCGRTSTTLSKFILATHFRYPDSELLLTSGVANPFFLLSVDRR